VLAEGLEREEEMIFLMTRDTLHRRCIADQVGSRREEVAVVHILLHMKA
jgi:hypothetical protein